MKQQNKERCVYKQEFSLCVCASGCLTCTSRISHLGLTWDSPELFHWGRLWWIYTGVRSAPYCWCCSCVTVSARVFACPTHRKTAWHEKKLFVCPSTEMRVRRSEKRAEVRGWRGWGGKWSYYTEVWKGKYRHKQLQKPPKHPENNAFRR